jgi:diguanylate cyclase (GGDEF)-like protein/PAS domain S-box-containing protein
VFWHNWTARAQTLARAERNISNLTYSLAQHASRTIETADLLLTGIVERVENGATSAYQLDRLHRHMAARAAAVPQIRELGVMNENGDWLASSLSELPLFNAADRDYFRFHKENADRAPRINAPLQSRVNSRWIILITRRINNADGTFGGVATAAIDVDYFQRFYETFNIGEHGSISLFLRDGTILVRRPFEAANMGRDVSNIAFFRNGRAEAAPSGHFRTKSPFDGRTKLAAYQRLSEYPLMVVMARGEDEVLAPWRQEVTVDAIVTATILSLMTSFGIFTIRQLRRRQQMEATITKSEERYRLLADNAADVVILLDFDGTRKYVSPSITEAMGYGVEEFLASPSFDMVHPEQRPFVHTVFKVMKDGSERQRLEYQLRRKDGSYVWVETNFKLVRDTDGEPTGVIAVVRDVSTRKAMEIELQTANTRLKSLAATDFLTGIANRRSFDLAIDQECRRSARSGAGLSVLFIDIDNFKGYNDYFGHSEGDECLRQVAQALNRCTKRPGDLAARYGGEEFALILPETDEAGAADVAEVARHEIAALKIDNPESKYGIVTISVGVAFMPGQSREDPDSLLKNADIALYKAKSRGRNQVVAWSQVESKIFKTA